MKRRITIKPLVLAVQTGIRKIVYEDVQREMARGVIPENILRMRAAFVELVRKKQGKQGE